LLTWNEYIGKHPEEAISAIYSHARGISKAACDWYWASIRRKRVFALSIICATLVLLVLGTLLPILAGLGDKPDIRLRYTQLGVAALACAGLLQVADRVFGLSSGWLRYMTTVTAMENRTRRFELEWAGYIIEKNGSIAAGDIKPMFDLAKLFEDDVANLQADETAKWATEFSGGVAVLGDLIKTQREAGEKNMEAARAAVAAQQDKAKDAQKKGAVELRLGFKSAPETVTIAWDQEAGQEFTGSTWARSGLEPGQHIVTVTTNTTPPQKMQKVVDVTPGGIVQTDIAIP